MSDPIAELARLRAETDAKLLRDAQRQFAWPDLLLVIPAAALALYFWPHRATSEAVILMALVMVIWRVSARLDAAVTLIQRNLPKAQRS
jgi:lipopolysaccharide export LptBFGC system permease protein LptF